VLRNRCAWAAVRIAGVALLELAPSRARHCKDYAM
jgi:hypothetical protein